MMETMAENKQWIGPEHLSAGDVIEYQHDRGELRRGSVVNANAWTAELNNGDRVTSVDYITIIDARNREKTTAKSDQQRQGKKIDRRHSPNRSKKRKNKNYGKKICCDCEQWFEKTGARQFRCRDCAKTHKKQQQDKWNRTHQNKKEHIDKPRQPARGDDALRDAEQPGTSGKDDELAVINSMQRSLEYLDGKPAAVERVLKYLYARNMGGASAESEFQFCEGRR